MLVRVRKNVIYIPSAITQLLQSVAPHSWPCITEELALICISRHSSLQQAEQNRTERSMDTSVVPSVVLPLLGFLPAYVHKEGKTNPTKPEPTKTPPHLILKDSLR